MKKIQETERKYNKFKDNVIRLKVLREEKEEELQTKQSECCAIEKTRDNLMCARTLLEHCNITSRNYIKVEVEQLVTQGLRSIFGDNLIKFNIEFVEKRNQTEALFYLTSEGNDSRVGGDIISAYGGGIVDIISINLRIIIMELLKLKGPLILDEPGKNISFQYIGNFGKFLVDISAAFDRQIIIITHNSALANCANNIIEVDQKNGISRVNVKEREKDTESIGHIPNATV